MNSINNSYANFMLDVNVNIQVKDNMGNIIKTVNKHNRATKQMLSGMLQFLRGEFNTSNRQTNYKAIHNIDKAKNYIPCYVSVGTAGIEVDEATHLPNYDENDRRKPPVLESWRDEVVEFTDTNLKQEVDSVSRYEIGVMDDNEATELYPNVADSVQFILGTDIAPNYYTSSAYTVGADDIFITEVGLFSTPIPNDGNLLARVALTKDSDILYVRKQDTILIRWAICIISLTDLSQAREEIDGQSVYHNVNMTGPELDITDERNDNNG